MLPKDIRVWVVLVVLLAAGGGNLLRDKLPSSLPGTKTTATRTQSTPPVNVPSGPVDVKAARAQLSSLAVRPAGSMAGYSRERFPHWADEDSDGCDTREEMLRRDGTTVKITGRCKVVSGVWQDPYGGDSFRSPSDIDIDHIVPLANAWRSGANTWNDRQRRRYANDPFILLAVSARLNRQKGDKGPEAWTPPNKGHWKAYAANWISIKKKYGLSVNPAEKAALTTMLGG